MINWSILNKFEYEKVWDTFCEKYKFNPSVHKKDWPSIITKSPYFKIDISSYYESKIKDIDNIIENIAIKTFQQITNKNEKMYALDWQHESYEFDPRLKMDRNNELNEWIIPAVPNGDYYIFLTHDFENVWFGHPWEESITLVGHKYMAIKNEVLVGFKKIKMNEFKDE